MDVADKACSKCKQSKPVSDFYRGRICKTCVLTRQASYYKANSEKVRSYVKQWRQDNPEKCRKYHKNYEAKYAEQERERHRLKSQRQPRDKRLEIEQRYNKNHPEAIRMKSAVRRSRKRNNGEYLILAKEVKKIYSSSCVLCGSTNQITADHIIPIVRGGRHSVGNLQPMCLSCNTSKGSKLMAEFRYKAK